MAAGVPDPVRVMVLPAQTVPPDKVGKACTVIVAEAVHPLLLVNEIMAVPTVTPVTNPASLTVATAGLEEVNGFMAAGVPVLLNDSDSPTQMLAPLKVGAVKTAILYLTVFGQSAMLTGVWRAYNATVVPGV